MGPGEGRMCGPSLTPENAAEEAADKALGNTHYGERERAEDWLFPRRRQDLAVGVSEAATLT